jgi:hypothetical protein
MSPDVKALFDRIMAAFEEQQSLGDPEGIRTAVDQLVIFYREFFKSRVPAHSTMAKTAGEAAEKAIPGVTADVEFVEKNDGPFPGGFMGPPNGFSGRSGPPMLAPHGSPEVSLKFEQLKQNLESQRDRDDADGIAEAIDDLVVFYGYFADSRVPTHRTFGQSAGELVNELRPGATDGVTFSRAPDEYLAAVSENLTGRAAN